MEGPLNVLPCQTEEWVASGPSTCSWHLKQGQPWGTEPQSWVLRPDSQWLVSGQNWTGRRDTRLESGGLENLPVWQNTPGGQGETLFEKRILNYLTFTSFTETYGQCTVYKIHLGDIH